MKLIVRVAELDDDGAPLLRLLREQLSPSIDERRFNWLYRLGPWGQARVWVAMEPDTGKMVGAAAAFPRKINLGGHVQPGCVFGDFCISPEHRSLGPAVQLQRKCLESVMNGEFTAAYDLPSNSMLAVYQRLGVKPNGQLVRMAKLLRSDTKIAGKVKSKAVARGLSAVANAALSMGRGSLKTRSGASIARHTGRFGSDFTDLASRIKNSLGSCVVRSAEYLNWRYTDHPQQRYEVLVARREGQLEGYLIFQVRDADASVADWFAEPTEVRGDLVRVLISTLVDRDCESIHIPVLAARPLADELSALGFRPRESSPVVVVGSKSGQAAGTQMDTTWLLFDGDRES